MLVSVKIANSVGIKIDKTFLNFYAMKKYKSSYDEKKKEVVKDLKELSEKYQTTKTSDLKTLIMAEGLPQEQKKRFLSFYEDKFTKFSQKK